MTISITSAVTFVVLLIFGGIIFGLLSLLIDKAPFLPEGWKPVGKYVLLVIAVLVLIGFLISLISGQPVFRP